MRIGALWKALAACAALAFAGAAHALVIINNSTTGFYNSGLGDLATDPVLGAQTDTATGKKLFPAANVSAGDPNIPPVATEPNLAGAGASVQAALGNFLGNTTSLGGSWSGAPVAIPQTWAVNTETAIVYAFDAGAGLSNFVVQMGVDNGAYVWLDGVYKFGAMAPGGASAYEYTLNVGNVSAGQHFLQILREDHGGGTGWTVLAQGDAATVPEPAGLALIGIGLAGLGLRRRRRSS